MKEGCLGDVFNVPVEGEGLVKNDAKISDVRGGGHCGAVNAEGEVVGGFGLHENSCNVVPKDHNIEVGSDTEIVCKTSCVSGKIYWTLNTKRINDSLSNTINSSHTVLSLRNFTHRSATLQCHSADNGHVLGGTTITTYIKITRPRLNVAAISDHLLVEWTIGAHAYQKYHCQVKYNKVGGEQDPLLFNKTLINQEKEQMTIKEVESCTNYTIAVCCALDEALWSDWSLEKTVLTKLMERDVKLHLWRLVGEAQTNGFRKVRAIWKEVPSTCQDTFTHTIKQTPYKENMTGANHTGTLCANSECDVNQEAHRIHLTVCDGNLCVNNSVYVPAIVESLPQVTDIQASTLEGVIWVSWKAPAQPVSGYMIDYTHDGDQYNWMETQYTDIKLSGLLEKQPYNITVTPLFDDKTGRGTQAPQICSSFGAPGNITKIVVQAQHKSAIVSWDMESQEPCSGVVVNYTVFYSTNKGPQLNVTVDSTMQQALLKDLSPETQYIMYVVATALTGTTRSNDMDVNTRRFDPRLSTVLSVCGGILIVLVLSLGLCCAVKWKKFKEKPVPNPGLSSVALWPSTSPKKLFHNPCESICEPVYTDEPQRPTTFPLATGCNDLPASDQADDHAVPTIRPPPVIQNEDLAEPEETEDLSSPGESTELLSSETSPSSPYRSQTSVETPTPRTSKQCKPVPVKPQEKMPLPSTYVSLDMFEQGQGR
ncbi:interleukin-6 receptor subunit beta-like [Symphorus nematophorus]